MSAEQQPIAEQKWWTVNAPYDILRRRELLEQGDTVRLADVDTYISYINEDMQSGYVVKTAIYQRDGFVLPEDVQEEATRIYLQLEDDSFEQIGVTVEGGAFYGQRIELLDEEPILIQCRELDGELTRLGVSLSESARIISDKRCRDSAYVRRMFHKLRWLGR